MSSAKQLFCLAAAAFAIGTESYVIAGLMPSLSADLGVSTAAIGQLITVFALAYALGSPVMAVLTAGIERRRLLLTAITIFGMFNLLVAVSNSYAMLLLARIGLALSAGTFMPAASAYAVAIVPPERRARALSVIFSGLTVATVAGVPLGVLAGQTFGWRFTFAAVAGLSFLALIGLGRTLARVPSGVTPALRERLAVARQPEMLGALAVTIAALAGAFSTYSYIAPFLEKATGLSGNWIAGVLFLFGIGSAVGNLVSGFLADRYGPSRIVGFVLGMLIILFAGLGLSAEFLNPALAKWIIVPVVAVWGLVGWSFPAAQQARIVALAPKLAPVALSLNASAIYLGVSAGAFLGGLAGRQGSFARVPWVGTLCEIAALALFLLSQQRHRTGKNARGHRHREPAANQPEPVATALSTESTP